jgi:hypothetical protein
MATRGAKNDTSSPARAGFGEPARAGVDVLVRYFPVGGVFAVGRNGTLKEPPGPYDWL